MNKKEEIQSKNREKQEEKSGSGKQESTEFLEEMAKEVETFNPRWNQGAFLGPNTYRKEETGKYGQK